MAGVMLFCTSPEAKPFISSALQTTLTGSDARVLYLVESRRGPPESEELRQELAADESFETDFLGASARECQRWALEMQTRIRLVEHDMIAIADARSAKDGTLLLSCYARGQSLEFGRYGKLPRESETWYDFRVGLSGVGRVYASMSEGAFEAVYPVYYGNKERLTSAEGVFDVEEAERLVRGEDREVLRF